MSNEISNALAAWALIQVTSAVDFRIVAGFGVRELVRMGAVGMYNLRFLQPLDFKVFTATVRIERARQVATASNLAGVLRRVYIGNVPINVAPSPYEAGSVALLFTDSASPSADVDDGICLVQVWQLPTVD